MYAQVVRDDIDELQDIDVDEHLGESIPLDLSFTNEKGEKKALQSFFDNDKPKILVLAYYNCPMLCTLVLNGLSETIRAMQLKPAEDYEILTISIDPSETPQLAEAKKKAQIGEIDKRGLDIGWHFFVGRDSSIRALADAIGFKYFYVEEREEYAHPAVLVVLTPDGMISRYLYGIEYPEFNLRLALLEASEGKIGSTLDKLILYCFHFDPGANGYVMFAANVMKLGGVATLIILGLFLGGFWFREIRKKRLTSA
jgi:protein SCO1/2